MVQFMEAAKRAIATICCTRKMLKETETEEIRLFCHSFIIGGISIGVEAGPLATSMFPIVRC